MSNKRLGPILVVVIVGAVVLAWIGRPKVVDSPVYAPAPVGWSPPSGFQLTDDPTVAYRWAEPKTEFGCDITDKCFGMFVVSQEGCQSLYVEVSLTDASGTSVGYSNDTASGLTPGQKAKLVFDVVEDDAKHARLAEVVCR